MRHRSSRRIATLATLCALAAAPAVAEVNINANLDLDELASCISDSGALFYGAHWCPMCRKQMAYFEDSGEALPYVECYDGPKSMGMNDACEDEGVRAFPTWVFGNGSIKRGALRPLSLAAATGCLGG